MSQEVHFPGEKTAKIRGFLNRYFPYIPLIALFIVAGYFTAFISLRYAHFIFETKGKVILAIDETSSKDEKPGIVQLKIASSSTSPEDRAMELFQSKTTMTIVVKQLDLYAEIISKGRFIKKPSYGVTCPLHVSTPNPDSITSESFIDLKLRPKLKQVWIKGVHYPAGKLVHTPWGWLKFDYSTVYKENPKENTFILHLIPPTALAGQILGKMRFLSKNSPSTILEIFIQDEIPERSLDVIPTMINVYDSLSAVKQREANTNIIKFIDQRLGVIAVELNGIETDLTNFKSTFKTDNLQFEGSTYFTKTQEIERELSTIHNQQKILVQIQEYLYKTYKGPKSLPSLVELGNPTITTQFFDLFSQEAQLEKLDKISGKKNPETVYIEERIAELKPAILESIRNLKRNYDISQKNLEDDLAHYTSMLKVLPDQERKLLDITRKAEAKNAIYTYLLQKREEIAINSAAIIPKTQILEKAEITKMVAPIPTSVFVLDILISIVLCILLISLIETLDNTIKSRADIERVLSIPIVGEISRISKFDPDRPIIIGKDIKSVPAEQFRSLRTNLNYLGLDGEHKVMLMTSSIMGEGKSFVTLNIAISIALSGKRIVLMDFDLRKPKISHQFIPDYSPGITDYLVGTSKTIGDITYQIPDFPNLYVIPSGTIPPNPSEIILGKKMADLMDEVREQYEFVMIDSPPVGIVTDAKLLAQYADICLYTIRQGTTPKMFLKIIEKLESGNILTNMGLILNDIKKTKFNEYGYTYEYSYEDEHPKNKGILGFLRGLFGLK